MLSRLLTLAIIGTLMALLTPSTPTQAATIYVDIYGRPEISIDIVDPGITSPAAFIQGVIEARARAVQGGLGLPNLVLCISATTSLIEPYARYE